MKQLTIVCWKWKVPGYRVNFTAEHVNVLMGKGGMIDRNYPFPHRRVCITDDPEGIECETFPLWGDCNGMVNRCGQHLPSCYRRLKIFDPAIARQLGERICSIDLDVAVTGELTPILHQPGSFVGWAVKGLHHARVYNGSLFMFDAGEHSDIWHTFDPQVSPDQSMRAGYFGSDQAWISFKLKGRAPGWTESQGVFSYPRQVRNSPLPRAARIVIFHGKRKPWDATCQQEAPWLKEHWRIA